MFVNYQARAEVFFEKKFGGFPARALSSTVDTGYEMHIIESYVFFHLYSAYSIQYLKLQTPFKCTTNCIQLIGIQH